MSTSQQKSLFGSQVRESVLTLFFLNASRHFYLHEIARSLGMSAGSIQRELKNLVQYGLIRTTKSGNRIYYQLNKDHALFEDLMNIFKKQGGLVQELESVFSDLPVDIAFIYGSYVTNKETADSDVDLFIVGNIGSAELIRKLEPLEKRLKRTINPYTIEAAELKRKAAVKNHFISTVLFKGKKLFIKGDESEIQKIIG